MRHFLFTIVLFISAASHLFAQDFRELAAQNWHQWRGPTGNGVGVSENPPVEWSETRNHIGPFFIDERNEKA